MSCTGWCGRMTQTTMRSDGMTSSRRNAAPALEVFTTLAVRCRVALLDRHPGVTSWLLVLPGTIWMMLFVGIPLASIVLFSFWRPGLARPVPDYNVANYAALLGGPAFLPVPLW